MMVRKITGYALAIALVVYGTCTVAFAAQNVANVSQKGSLLVFPRIDTSPVANSSAFHDTIVTIGNDYPGEVYVKCYWINRDQEISGFTFRMTANQPVWFRASDGAGTGLYDRLGMTFPLQVAPFFPGDHTTGELKCWAVDDGDTTQIVFNHLYGSAMIFDPTHRNAFQYHAWSFTARNAGTPGSLVLDGATNYDACPLYLTYNFFSKGSSINLPHGEGNATFLDTSLTLVPCHQDLRQDRFPTCTKAKFDIWNEDEVKYANVHQCVKCWFEGYLGNIGKHSGGLGGAKFLYRNLHTIVGRFRVQGMASTACKNVFATTDPDGNQVDPCWTDPADTTFQGQVATPLLGVIATEISFDNGAHLGAVTGSPGNTAGAWGPPLDAAKYPVPQILWAVDEPPSESPRK